MHVTQHKAQAGRTRVGCALKRFVIEIDAIAYKIHINYLKLAQFPLPPLDEGNSLMRRDTPTQLRLALALFAFCITNQFVVCRCNFAQMTHKQRASTRSAWQGEPEPTWPCATNSLTAIRRWQVNLRSLRTVCDCRKVVDINYEIKLKSC